jgi:tetratricopeptide (TPR) repeat protein
LYTAAIDEYQKILDLPGIDQKTRANINYLIGKIYFENLNEYEKAAGYYVRANSLDPDGSFSSTASKNLVASLEKMGRMLDASRQLSSLTSVDTAAPEPGDVKVAQIEGDPVWLSEVEAAIQRMPVELQQEYKSREAKVQFVRQYVATEMMYRAAIREGYDELPEVKDQLENTMRDLLVSKYMADKVMPRGRADSSDVRNYYVVNKDVRYDGKEFSEVRAQVYQDYQNEKAMQAFNGYVEKLARAEKVKFFDHNVN